ncbi:helix-turn-helix transcriptional regulator [Ramlibacter albus]|uniref:Helix-turn-helix transcriptional regulator n=1 Tax=Ramlibacter albus TaxID=2079448 RepID=A0A923MBD6_9BURK|nr:helix-turn-helix transcriptional regulator [Ramlibacter albus]MBC5767283.1 helix-turn-helix transcriptional regulator [Ramlibacter albus]
MPLIRELGTAVRQRRIDIGLSQQALAELAELSRVTVNELERGKLVDLSANRVERLANELGFAVGLVGVRRKGDSDPFEVAARVASVPYSPELPAHVLLEAVRDGSVPPDYIPHVRHLLQEAPVAILAGLAEHLDEALDVPRTATWKRMSTLAGVLQCDRPLWRATRT